MHYLSRSMVLTCLFLAWANPFFGQPGQISQYNLSEIPVLYTVGYAHLDTEWRWDYETTIRDYLKATLDDNFTLFEKYPPYVFSFSGARRYRMMKEYYPERYQRLKKYIYRDRWFVAGSSVDECDVNIPSPESVIRQVLYGNQYFKKEFGKESVDFLLPDCFGFQAHLPSVLNHCGIRGFSTQKLGWGSAVGIPFNVGMWIGPDGKGLVAALNPTSYTSTIQPRLDTSGYWKDRITKNGKNYGLFADFRYYGVGDIGGAPREADVINAVQSLDHPDRLFTVYLCSSDQLFRDITVEQKTKLPVYQGDLLLTQHSAGSLTSQAYMKRWNRKNELLAQAAEPLAWMADYLGAMAYPKEILHQAWWLVLGNQMHDILPGTSIPSAYHYAWNDAVIGLNLFASVLESSAGSVIRAMDTRGNGKSVVVYNPLSIPREDIVEADLGYPEGTPDYIRVFNPEGVEVPSQVTQRTKNSLHILFTAVVPSLGLACYDIQAAKKPSEIPTGVHAGRTTLQNDFYQVSINSNGDISGILDKRLDKELLSGPVRLEFLKEHPRYWPAWNMDWKDRQLPPIGYVEGPVNLKMVETGPVRVTCKIERLARNSVFTQYIQLSAGQSGSRILIKNRINWQSKGVSLKASFPLTAKNEKATYNLGLGTIERSTNEELKYEVPSREWFDLTDNSGKFGVTILKDSRFGSDKPNDSTLRLTLLYTPKTNEYHDQATQDWGIHDVIFGISSHPGNWKNGLVEWQGRELNQPLIAFLADQHPGFLGKSVSLLTVSNPRIGVQAMKQSEADNLLIVRLQELSGEAVNQVSIDFPGDIQKAWEVDGQEQLLRELPVRGNSLLLDFRRFEIRSLAVRLISPMDSLMTPEFKQVLFIFNQDVVSSDSNRRDGNFCRQSVTFPAELFPSGLVTNGIPFELGGTADGQNNVMPCAGQKIMLPKVGNYTKIYFLAAALKDTVATFKAGNTKQAIRIQGYTGNIGQFDRRRWDKFGKVDKLEKGYIKRDQIAWFSTHMHQDTTNLPYHYGYIFLYEMDVTPGSAYFQLPENETINIFAITLADNPYDRIQLLQPLYDDFTDREEPGLNTEKRYVMEPMIPVARVSPIRKKNLDELPASVSSRDYASLMMPNGVTVTYYETDSAKEAVKTTLPLRVSTDGMFDLLPSDSAIDVWHTCGEGRLLMDLQKEIGIDSLHLFVSLDLERGAPAYSLWGNTGNTTPVLTGDPAASGWSYIASIPQIDLWNGGKALYTLIMDELYPFRYLLWISEDSGYGPVMFREIDVFENQK